MTLVEGSTNTLSAPSPQVLNGTTYVFSSWSDGGAQTHTISANASDDVHGDVHAAGRRHGLLRHRPRRLPGCLLAPGRGARARRRPTPRGNGRTGSYLNTPTLGVAGALTGDSNTAVAFNGTNEYVQRALRRSPQPGLLHGRGVGVS